MTLAEVVRLVVVASAGLGLAALGLLLWRRPALVIRGSRAATARTDHPSTAAIRRLGLVTVAAGLVLAGAGVWAGFG